MFTHDASTDRLLRGIADIDEKIVHCGSKVIRATPYTLSRDGPVSAIGPSAPL
jgi:hypothetical protein